MKGLGIGGVVGIKVNPRVVVVCCEPETPWTASLKFPEVAFETAVKPKVVAPAMGKATLAGETVTPGGNPVTVTVTCPGKPFSLRASTCTS